MMRAFVKNTPFGFAYAYRKSIEVAENREAARVKVENSHADILLLGGKKDGWWDTHEACLRIMEELSKHQYPYHHDYIAYEGAGHACYAPFVLPAREFTAPLKMAPRLVFSEEAGVFRGG